MSTSSKLMQAALVLAAGWKLCDHLCVAFFMQTVLFVAFNQVGTSALHIRLRLDSSCRSRVMKLTSSATATAAQPLPLESRNWQQSQQVLVCLQVCTAQYFVWYFSLLPLMVPWLKVGFTSSRFQPACLPPDSTEL